MKARDVFDPAVWGSRLANEDQMLEFAARKWDIVRDSLPDFAGWPVLDIGCWSGYTTLALAADGADAHGMDINPGRLTRAAESAEALGISARFHQANLHRMAEWLTATGFGFRLVWCAGVLHHLWATVEGLYNIAHATSDWLVIECRTTSEKWAAIHHHSPHPGDYATVWASIPSPEWVRVHLLAAGFDVIESWVHWTGDRSMFVARRLPVVIGDERTDLSSVPDASVVSLPLTHEAFTIVPELDNHYDRWPRAGAIDDTVSRIVARFDPALFVPGVWTRSEGLVDSQHRVNAARSLGLSRFSVIIDNTGRMDALRSYPPA